MLKMKLTQILLLKHSLQSIRIFIHMLQMMCKA